MAIFHLSSYREIIQKKLDEFGSNKGYKTILSQVMQIQSSHFSQIMSGKVNLTPDQGSRLCDHWHLSDLEAEYFINLIHLDRATTQSLKERIQKQLERIRHDFVQGAEIIAESVDQFSDKESLIFSSWIYPAVNSALRITDLRTEKDIADRLEISRRVTRKVLENLKEMGFATNNGPHWSSTNRSISKLTREASAMLHHELRAKAHETYTSGDTEIVRYGSVGSIPAECFADLRNKMQNFIRDYHKEYSADFSNEGEIVCLTLDFFRIGRRLHDTSEIGETSQETRDPR